jgi:hypothetical protein
MPGLEEVSTKLDEWLNGGVFPDHQGKSGPQTNSYVKCGFPAFLLAPKFPVAAINPPGFPARRFFLHPRRNTSVVYEQFGAEGKGSKTGAYYTDSGRNLMLSQLDHDLRWRGCASVFDPHLRLRRIPCVMLPSAHSSAIPARSPSPANCGTSQESISVSI